MAGATTVSYLDVLKEDFSSRGIRPQINNERLLWDLAHKTTQDFDGKTLIVPMHVRRNGSTSSVGEGGVAPAPGTQGYIRLVIDVAIIASSAQLTTQVIKRSATDMGAFISAMESETKGVVVDQKNQSDLLFWTGGLTKGLLNEHKATGLTANAGGFNQVSTNFEYAGSVANFSGVVKATPATWQRVDLTRLDNLPEEGQLVPGLPFGYTTASVANGMLLLGGGGATKVEIYVSDISSFRTLGVIELTAVSDAVGASFTTAVVQAGTAIALAFSSLASTIAGMGDGAVPVAALASVLLQPNGIMHNLYSSTIYTVARTSSNPINVLTDNVRMQSTAFTNATAGAHARAALDKNRIQDMFDRVNELSGEDFDMLITAPTQRSKYYALLTATTQWLPQGAVQGGDLGIKRAKIGKILSKSSGDVMAFNGLPILATRHCPKGLWFGWKDDTWIIATLDEAGWLDQNGSMLINVIDPTTGRPSLAYIMVWEDNYNLYCDHYSANATLCGMNT